ncbi:alpha-amylase family glycosyl hydrolase [Haloferula sp.]|uniref:alpha-amylase family glycosyl hydrolase n=1 Tax=Haloferula sp. TaxID=2497595 RepID=UPI0032A05F72
MGDFHQQGSVTTLHQLSRRPIEEIEGELVEFGKSKPMALILPSLFSELEGEALPNIVDELTHVPYLDQVVIGLDRADEDQYRHAVQFFERLPQDHRVLWNDGPRLRKIDAMLQAHGLAPDQPGKGRNVWYMFGYVLATNKAQAVALHDCDITTYDRSMLARLIYPVANPNFTYRFCKGFYARVAQNTLNGRVCRLLVTPLLRALKSVCGSTPYLDFLDSFRYPLAGEFSLGREVIEDIRIPSDWGLEMGVLSEMHRNHATSHICQVDIADTYDHKHQDLSLDDKAKGLSKMSMDISKSLFRKMATQGHVFSTEKIRTIKATYFRIALDLIEQYHDDAVINGLKHNRHTEGEAVESFAENIMMAGQDFLEKSMETPFMPSWKRVISAVPDVMEQLVEAVELDAREFGPKEVISLSSSSNREAQRLHHRVHQIVAELYPGDSADDLTDNILLSAGIGQDLLPARPNLVKWTESDAIVISYGDSIIREGERPLQTLRAILDEELGDAISGVHILPFYPFTSDDGFSVVDYHAVNQELGNWADIKGIASEKTLMVDVVLNHCSASSEWFQNFLKDESPGKDYFVHTDPSADLSQVVRPRASDLLHEVETSDGTKHVWCTFSHDQVDLNFKNAEVLLEFVRILREYVSHGVKFFRLDAVAYLWKKVGTSCIHLEETHSIIKLLRLLVEAMDQEAVLITETNVPNLENLTYFGNNNEAHLIYNFSLPPLLIHALLSGEERHMKSWLMKMPAARLGRAYLNFIASHDGIGMRPAEGVLDHDEIAGLLTTLQAFGGEVSTRLKDGEERPYEVNISLYDAFRGTIQGGPDQHQLERFIAAHTIMLALEGIPAFYIHSLFGTENDHELYAETGRKRSINRHRWDHDKLKAKLADKESHHHKVLEELKRRIEIRRKQAAFHPNATQYTLHCGHGIFAFWRESLDRSQSVFVLNNLSSKETEVSLVELNLTNTEKWCDLLVGGCLLPDQDTLVLPPYGSAWLSNQGATP